MCHNEMKIGSVQSDVTTGLTQLLVQQRFGVVLLRLFYRIFILELFSSDLWREGGEGGMTTFSVSISEQGYRYCLFLVLSVIMNNSGILMLLEEGSD